MSSTRSLFVGIDWAKSKHDIVMLEGSSGAKLAAFSIPHDSKGLSELHQRVADLGYTPSETHVAIETPHGSVVASCWLRGDCVWVLNPKQLDRFRDRYFLSGAKDDRRDAEVLASALRSDPQSFRRLCAPHGSVRVLSQVLKIHDDLVQRRGELLNQFQALLHESFPQFERVLEDLDLVWVRELWKRIPTQSKARTARVVSVATLLKKHRVRSFTAQDLLEKLRADEMPLLPGVEEACEIHLRVLVEQLDLLHEQINITDRELKHRIDALRVQSAGTGVASGPSDVDLIESMPGVGPYVTAALLTEASEEIAQRNYDRLRAVSGVAPVTRRSGNRLQVVMRRACRPVLRNAIYHLARTAMQNDATIKARYRRLRERGKPHGTAIRATADGILRSLVAMLKSREPWRSAAPRDEEHQQTA